MANKHREKGSASLFIREMQIKITMRHYIYPPEWLKLKRRTDTKYCQECGAIGTLIHCWWEYKLVQALVTKHKPTL